MAGERGACGLSVAWNLPKWPVFTANLAGLSTETGEGVATLPFWQRVTEVEALRLKRPGAMGGATAR